MASPSKTRSPKRAISSRTPTKRGTPDKKIPRHESNVFPTDLDCKQQEALCSKEILRSSPELWPEKIPGVGEFASHFGTSAVLSKSEAVASSLDSALEKDDRDMLQEFGSLTTSQLMDKVKALQNLAYQLGLEEVQRGTKLKNTMKKGWETALFLTKCQKQSMSEAGGMLGSLAREMTRGKFLNILGKSDFRR
eukprot:gene19371-21294_t